MKFIKTLKTIFILLALVCTNSSFAQIKEETEQWLNEKFKKIVETKPIDIAEGKDPWKIYHKVQSLDVKNGKISFVVEQRYIARDNGDKYIFSRKSGKDLPVNKIEFMHFSTSSLIIFREHEDYGISVEHEDTTSGVYKRKITYDYSGLKHHMLDFAVNLDEFFWKDVKETFEYYITFFTKEE